MAKQQQRTPSARTTSPATPARKPAAPKRTESRNNIFTAGKRDFIFGRENFLYFGIGLALVVLGLAAMTGGAMPDPAKWEPERIYSFRRITLAPIMMVSGFVVVIIGIFKTSGTGNTESGGDA
jgi:hypothetical protein